MWLGGYQALIRWRAENEITGLYAVPYDTETEVGVTKDFPQHGAAGRAAEGGQGMEPASAVGGAVVDFDGGCVLVDVDGTQECEPVDVGRGDGVDGQSYGVQRVGHCGQPGGEDVSRHAVVTVQGW